jgi:hypothetical protein
VAVWIGPASNGALVLRLGFGGAAPRVRSDETIVPRS